MGGLMSRNSMADLVSKVQVGKDKTSKAKEYAHASEWPKCSHNGCPLPTTIKDETVTCTYHHRQHGLNATCITEAVKEFLPYIKKHNEMIFWDVRQWKQKRPQIMGWAVLPATEQEMNFPTLYIQRPKKFIDDGITERADEIDKGHV